MNYEGYTPYIIIVIVIILLLVFYFFFYKKQSSDNKNEKMNVIESIPMPIFIETKDNKYVNVGDIDNLNRRDNRDVVDENDLREGEVYFKNENNELQYMGEIMDLKPDPKISPSSDTLFLLKKDNDKNICVIHVVSKKK